MRGRQGKPNIVKTRNDVSGARVIYFSETIASKKKTILSFIVRSFFFNFINRTSVQSELDHKLGIIRRRDEGDGEEGHGEIRRG